MMDYEPIRPEDVSNRTLPGMVICAVNKLIEQQSSTTFSLKQADVETAIRQEMASRGYKGEMETWWLNFEPMYRRAGWNVRYDKPGYNESYPPTYAFSPGVK